jgi:DNA polymerase-3 subunit beta
MLKIKTTNDKLLGPLQQVTGSWSAGIRCRSFRTSSSRPPTATSISSRRTSKCRSRRAQRSATARKGSITAAARKLYDILRSLPDDAEVSLEAKESRMTVRAGKSRFNLQTLAAADFPRMVEAKGRLEDAYAPAEVAQARARAGPVRDGGAGHPLLPERGALLGGQGHAARRRHRRPPAFVRGRGLGSDHGSIEAILPRKTVLELIKLLGDTDDPVSLAIGSNQVRFSFGGIEIVSKIVEGKFPDYQKVIPTQHKNRVEIDRAALAQSLNRAAILSNEKIRGVRLVFTKDALSIICTNNEQEEAEEGLALDYSGDPLDIGFNISYLLDVLNHVETQTVSITMGDSNSSALVQMPGRDDSSTS